jgi:hypothetical protein
MSVKEEMPILVAAMAIVVLGEKALRRPPSEWRREGLRPYAAPLAVVGLAVVTLPLLMVVLKLHPKADAHALGSFERIKVTHDVTSAPSLAWFVATHLSDWLGTRGKTWVLEAGLASLGLLALRLHWIALGIVLSLTSWLMQDEPLWPPRFAATLAFAWCVSIVAFASAWKVVERFRAEGRTGAAIALALGIAGLGSACFVRQAALVPQAVEVYEQRPWSYYTPEERATADEVFAAYREQARPEEPVTATLFLMRYAHDRELYWHWALEGNPRPIWVLWDERWPEPRSKFGLGDDAYELVRRKGRFALFRVKS